MTRRVAFLVCAFAASASTGAPQTASGYKVVVNASNPAGSLRREQVADLFLKKATRWPGGAAAAPVDLSASSPIRGAFTTDVLRRSVREVQTYWSDQVFAGRDLPPPVQSSEADVLAFVGRSAGALGYVSAELSLPAGVKALKVEKDK